MDFYSSVTFIHSWNKFPVIGGRGWFSEKGEKPCAQARLGGTGVKLSTVFTKTPKWFHMTRVWNTGKSGNDVCLEVDQMAKVSSCLAEAELLGSSLGKSFNLSVPPVPHL